MESSGLRVFIFGSCVSRDILNFATKDAFHLVDYYARCSMASLASEPYIDNGILGLIASPFQRRMVSRDFSKELLVCPELVQADIILIDLIDERLNIAMLETGEIVTASSELHSTGFLDNGPIARTLPPGSAERFAFWQEGAGRFFAALRDRNMLSRVVINRVYWADVIDGQTDAGALGRSSHIESANSQLDRLYEELLRWITPDQFMTFDRGLFMADPNHRWGLSAFHYVPAYYQDAMRRLKKTFQNITPDPNAECKSALLGSLGAIDPVELVRLTTQTALQEVRPDWKRLHAKQLNSLLEGKLILASGTVVPLTQEGGLDWSMRFETGESANVLWMYSLEYVGALLSRFEETDEAATLSLAIGLLRSFFNFIDSPGQWEEVATNRGYSSRDHAMAIRANVLVRVIQSLLRSPVGDEDLLRRSVAWLFVHAEWLYDDLHYTRSNHGVMCDFALLQCALQFRAAESLYQALLNKADKRLCDMIASTFDADGLCNENTIGYHNYNLGLYRNIAHFLRKHAINTKFLEVCTPIIKKAEQALSIAIWQDRQIPPIGDSPVYQINTQSLNCSKLFRESHFLVVKNDDLYLSLICGSRYDGHKQVDDSSVTLRYRGENILVDGGSYTYNRKDPVRKCLESSRGHSGIFAADVDTMPPEIYLRSDTRGLAEIVSFEEDANRAVAICRYTLFNNGIDITRRVTVNWPDEVLFQDTITTSATMPATKALQRFIFSPHLVLDGNQADALSVRLKGNHIQVTINHGSQSTPVAYTGESEPVVRGWYSEVWQQVLPTLGIDYSQLGHSLTFETRFKISDLHDAPERTT